jgi:hypothetical protein
MKNFTQKILLLILFVLGNAVFSQEKKLEITHIESGKARYIKENKRVVLKTVSGEKHKGKLFFIDENSIKIKGDTIMLEDIYSLRRNPLVKSIVKTTLLATGGVLIAGGGVALATATTSNWNSLAAAILIGGAVVIPLPLYFIVKVTDRIYKNTEWSYKIILENNH